MDKILIVCKSITNAQNIMSILNRNGFWANISRTPSDIRLKNCSYSVISYRKDFENIKRILNSKNIQYLNIYQQTNDGLYQKFGGDNDLF